MSGNRKPEFKIPLRKVLSDDCIIHIGRKISEGKIVDQGKEYRLHQGEWVEVLPIGSMKQYASLLGLAGASVNGGGSLRDLCNELSKKIIDWNWTGMDKKPLPDPYKNTEVIMDLSEEEILWLITAIQGETESERKKDSDPSMMK